MLISKKTLAKAKKAREQFKAQQDTASLFKLEDYLFKEQLDFVNDPSPFKVAVCSRRAGKSTSIAADLVLTACTFKECTALYITGTRTDAKKIIWAEILKFNRKHNLGGVPNISELTLSFPSTGSLVRLAGAKDEQEIEKIRGQLPPIKKAYIDESQSIRDSVLTKLIDDVLEAALLDYAASLALCGTPGSIPAGYFHRISHNLDEKGNPLPENVWALHGWTFFNNPHIAIKSKTTHDELLKRVLKRRGVGLDHPSIQREFFGKWTQDSDSLLLQYKNELNHYNSLPELPNKQRWNFVMGIDLGFDDSDAIAVLAWSEHHPAIFLVEEKVVPQQGLTELVAQINEFSKKYDISKMMIDQGGLGKKLAEEMRRQHGIPVVAAEKTRKMENLAFLNDALRTGRFKAKKDSKFAQDTYLVEIDKDKSTPDKIKISTKYHSDIIDAVLYAAKECPNFAYVPPPVKPKPGTPEWAKQNTDEMFERELARMQELQNRNDSENWDINDYDPKN